MLDYKYSGYTVGERFDQMLGIGASPTIHAIRLAELAAAVYTSSHPEATFYIAPYQWVIGVLIWYFYPA